MKNLRIVAVVTSMALTTAACDQLFPPKSASKQSAGEQALKTGLPEMSKFAGRDICSVAEKLDSSEGLKKHFVGLFGEARWTTWQSYSPHCGPIEVINDPQLGELMLLEKVELVGNMGANSGQSATLFVRPNGSIEAACFANNGSDGNARAEWLGSRWHNTESADQCSYDIRSKDKLINLKIAMSPKARLEMKRYVGKDICEVMDELGSSPVLKRNAVLRVGTENWTSWVGYTANCDPIEMVKDADLGELVVLPRHDRAYAPMSAVLFVRPDGEVEAGCFSDDGEKYQWAGAGWSRSSVEEQCATAGTPQEQVRSLKVAMASAKER